MRPLIIGIAGGSGSGKSTLAAALVEALSPDCLHIIHDRYYHSLTCAQRKTLSHMNFDHPDSLDTLKLLSDLDDLCSKGSASLPLFAFETHRRVGEEPVTARPYVLVEGILTFADETLRERMDVRVFVDADEDVRLSRRVRRDVAERGRTEEEVRSRFASSVRPMHAEFVEPTKAQAHLVVDGTQQIEQSVAQVLSWITARESALRP